MRHTTVDSVDAAAAKRWQQFTQPLESGSGLLLGIARQFKPPSATAPLSRHAIAPSCHRAVAPSRRRVSESPSLRVCKKMISKIACFFTFI